MYELFKKYLKRFFLPLKIGVVFVACYLIYKKLDLFIISDSQIKFPAISIISLLLFVLWMLIFTTINWLLEIYKWKLLVSKLVKISFYDSLVQSLSSHTVALMTPFKSGEFGVKTMFYERSLFKKIIDLNFIGNLSQLLMTVLFGVLGLYFYQYALMEHIKITVYDGYNSVFLYFTIAILLVILLFFSMKKFINFSLISFKRYLHISGVSMLRYLIFSHQYLLLLFIFYPNLNYQQTITAIFSMYLSASIIPTLALFDWAVKGSFGILYLSILGFQVDTIVLVSLLMWFFNFALPAILGSYFVLTLNSKKILING